MNPSQRTPLPPSALVAQLRALGLAEVPVVVVHSSLRAVGPVEGGPLGLIAALRAALSPEATLVMPSMSDDDERPFDTATTPCAAMGVVADTFWRQPGVVRSDNPASFAAVGPLASVITAPHPIAPPHGIDSPVGRACALGGSVLLLGVDHSANTTMHLAESMAGVPYASRKECVVLRDGVLTRVAYEETDHCCENFQRVDAWLRDRGLLTEGTVGYGAARLARASDVVRVAVGALREDAFAFLHARGGGCEECDEAWASVGPA
jgi:aminoglycoside N3'-acetyltransferase